MMDTRKFCRFSEDEIKAMLKSRMNEHRFEHSLNVAERAVFLAEKNGAEDFLILAITMLSNFVLEFLFCKFVVYRGKENTLPSTQNAS